MKIYVCISLWYGWNAPCTVHIVLYIRMYSQISIFTHTDVNIEATITSNMLWCAMYIQHAIGHMVHTARIVWSGVIEIWRSIKYRNYEYLLWIIQCIAQNIPYVKYMYKSMVWMKCTLYSTYSFVYTYVFTNFHIYTHRCEHWSHSNINTYS